MGGETNRHHTTAVVTDVNPLRQERTRLVLRRVGIEVVAGSPSVEQSAKLAEIYGCDLLVVGAADEVDPASVYRVLRRAHKVRPELVSVTVVEEASTSMVEAALAAGSFAVVTQPASADELSSVIRTAMADKRSESSSSAPRCRLTRREIGILRLVAEGRSNREVAKVLWVSDQTVKFHLANIYKKLGVRNRVEASAWAVSRGLVQIERLALLAEPLDGRLAFNASEGAVAVLP